MAEMRTGVANKPAYDAVSTAPVVSPMRSCGASRATSARNTPFQPLAVRPKAAASAYCPDLPSISPQNPNTRCTYGHSQPEADQDQSCGIDAHRKESPSEPPQQTSGLRTGKCGTGFEMAEPEFAYTERDKVGVERELHSAEGHRSRGERCDTTVGAYQRQSCTHAELRRRLRQPFISGSQPLEYDDPADGTGGHRCVGPLWCKPDGDRGQRKRAADCANLIAGLAQREYQRTSLIGNQFAQQCRTGGRLGAEGEAETKPCQQAAPDPTRTLRTPCWRPPRRRRDLPCAAIR